MYLKKVVFLVMVFGVAVLTAHAAVEYSVGTGDNEAFLTVDFGYEAFDFSYKWDGLESVSGWTLLDEIDSAGALDVDATWYESFQSHLINDLSYDVAAKYAGGSSWGYYTSTDGAAWTSSGVGLDLRQVSDGDWDGWSWGPVDGDTWEHLRAPGEAVPEPVSLMLLGTGALLIRARKK